MWLYMGKQSQIRMVNIIFKMFYGIFLLLSKKLELS